MPIEPPLSCQVSNVDLFFMVLGYVRYAMGRMSTAPSTAQDLVGKYGHALSDRQLSQIGDEIESNIALEERTSSTLGATVDHETWKETLALVRRQLALRS
jgi:hypothetical protein